MRKLLLLLAAFLPILLWSQAQRMVLIEEFTNASCGPCASQNPAFNALLSANTDKVIAIKYQAAFPGFDPMNVANPQQVSTRGNYYGLNGVPTAWIDGILPDNSYGGGIGAWNITSTSGYAGGPYGYNQAVMNYAASQPTPISIRLTHSLSADLSTVTINAVVKNVSSQNFAVTGGRFHVVLMERSIEFPVAPGSNGETEFSNVMRRMYPDANGTQLNTLAAGDSLVFNFTEAIPDYLYDLREISVAAFLQDNTDKRVYQAAYSEPQEIEGSLDVAFGENLTTPPTSLCGASITPTVEVFNNGGDAITSMTIGVNFNDELAATETWSGQLAPGATVEIAFDEVNLPGGSTRVSFTVVDVNNGATDLNRLNNETPVVTYSSLAEEVYGTNIQEDNEGYIATYPTIAVVEEPVPNGSFGDGTFLSLQRSDLTSAAGDQVGGYGQSARSLFVNFYQWNPAESNAQEAGTMTYPKLDFSTQTNVHLKFDRSHARYQTSNDRLQVLVSTDCGATWTVVYNKAGAALATRPAQNNFYVPPANGWATDSISLAAYQGQGEVNIQFKVLSDWGNTLYIDNINVLGTPVGTNDLENLLAGKVAVFPNPVSAVANIEFELVEATPVTIEILNINGQVVTVLDQQRDYAAGQYIRNWNPENAGVYFARIRTKLGETTKRIVVTK